MADVQVLSSKIIEEEHHGVRRAVRVDSVIERGSGRREMRYDLYVTPPRADGQIRIVAMPSNDADQNTPGQAAMSCISRTTITSKGPEDTYLRKGFKWATKADLERDKRQLQDNEDRAANNKQRRDPEYLERLHAKLQADAIVVAMNEAKKPASGGSRNG